jgi:hypothetical protein
MFLLKHAGDNWGESLNECSKSLTLHLCQIHISICCQRSLQSLSYRSFATRVPQLKIWHFWVTGIERNVCRCTFNWYSVITQFAKLAAGEQLCRRCTHKKLYYFKTFKNLSWKIPHFELWHCCPKWAMWVLCFNFLYGKKYNPNFTICTTYHLILYLIIHGFVYSSYVIFVRLSE